jgi:hypothetical protein
MADSGLPRSSMFLTSKVGSGNPMGYLDTKEQVPSAFIVHSPAIRTPSHLARVRICTSFCVLVLLVESPVHAEQIQAVLTAMNVTYVDLMLVGECLTASQGHLAHSVGVVVVFGAAGVFVSATLCVLTPDPDSLAHQQCPKPRGSVQPRFLLQCHCLPPGYLACTCGGEYRACSKWLVARNFSRPSLASSLLIRCLLRVCSGQPCCMVGV